MLRRQNVRRTWMMLTLIPVLLTGLTGMVSIYPNAMPSQLGVDFASMACVHHSLQDIECHSELRLVLRSHDAHAPDKMHGK